MNTKNWERADLKERARDAVKRNYWWCVLAALILALITGGNSSGNRNRDRKEGNNTPVISVNLPNFNEDFDVDDIGEYLAETAGKDLNFVTSLLWGAAGGVIAIVGIVIVLTVLLVSTLLKVLLFNPLEVGGRKFFVENETGEKKGIGAFGDAFRNGYYGNIVTTMLMKDLSIFLWGLLLVIPGIIKAYEYRMVPYILGEHPELGYREALERSRAMMDGQKANAFVLDLSFIGWRILSSITAGLVGLFWVNPYIYATNAELYLELSDYGSYSADMN